MFLKRLYIIFIIILSILFSIAPNCNDNKNKTDAELFYQYLNDLKSAKTTNQKEKLTQEFIKTIEYSNGFPIFDEKNNEIIFVYLQEYGLNTPIRVSGDFNNWNPNQYYMEQAEGYYLFYKAISIANPYQRLKYKYVVKDSNGNDLWIRDPNARRFDYDEYGEYSLIYGGKNESHLERYHNFYANMLDNYRDLWIYLPPGYYFESQDYPILYMHDGQNLFDPNAFFGGWKVDQVVDDLIYKNQIKEIIVCGISNTSERMDEYTHVEDIVAPSPKPVGGDAPLYADLVVNQIKPFMDERYRTSTNKYDTGILGSSLGGLVSFWIGYTYPNIFYYVGGMSSTFGWGSINMHNPTMIEIINQNPKKSVVYYLDSGGDDGGGCYDRDNDGINDDNPFADDNFCETDQMKNVLLSKGYKYNVDLYYYYDKNAEHNEIAWNNRLYIPLKAFYSK